MSTLSFQISLCLLLSTMFVFGNNGSEASQKGHKNEAVENVLQLRKEGKIEASIKAGLQIFAAENDLNLKDSLKVVRLLAYNLLTIGDYEHALDYAKKTIYLDQKLNAKKTANYLFLGQFFSACEQYDSTIYYLKINAEDRLSKSNKDDYGLAKTHNNIGFTYYLAGQLDSAEVYYKKVTSINVKNEDYMDIVGLATGNLGQLYFDKKDYKNALVNMNIDAKLTKNRIKESYYNATLGIAECHLMMDKYKDAEKTLLQFFDFNIKNQKLLIRSYQLMATVLEKRNNHSKSAVYLRKYIHLTDSLAKNEIPKKELINQLSINRIDIIKSDLALSESKIRLMNNELLLAKVKEKSSKFKNRIYIILIIISFFSAILSVFYFRNRHKKNMAIQALESDLLESEIQNKKKDLNNLATNLSYKRKFIDEIQLKLKELIQKPEESLKDNISKLIREFTSYKNADKSVEVMQADIDKVNLSFFNKLSEKFPLLTENEKELCGLFLLKLSSKDIAIIRNVTPNAIKKARQRIRKKLPITENEKIVSFLESV